MKYTCKHNDVLDAVCYEIYGDENKITEVYDLNPGLADHGVFLPEGLVIQLPETPAQEPVEQTIELWS